MEDYRSPGSRVNPKNAARVMSRLHKVRGRIQGAFVFGNLFPDVENTGALLDRGDRKEPSTINSIGANTQ